MRPPDSSQFAGVVRRLEDSRAAAWLARLAKPDDNPWPVLLLAGLIGFVYGALIRPVPLVSLEAAQVVAGIVDLPSGNPMQVNHTSTYSLFLIQLPALLLRAGFSEPLLSAMGSGVQGALCFSAIGVCGLAFSSNRLVALLMPLALIKVPSIAGHKYPTEFATDAYDAGVVGFYFALLALSLLALGRFRSGLLLLALAPAVHPSLGVAAWLIALTGLLGSRRRYFSRVRDARAFLLAGLTVLIVSYAVQRLVIQVPPGVTDGDARALVDSFETHWDGHRKPAGFVDRPDRIAHFFEIDAWMVLLTAALLVAGKDLLTEAGRFLLIGFLACTGVALIYTVSSEFALTSLPLNVRALMITRWLNFNSAVFPIVVLGVLSYGGFAGRLNWALWTLVGSLGILLAGVVDRKTLLRSDWLGRPEVPAVDPFGLLFPALTVVLVAGTFLIKKGRTARPSRPRHGSRETARVAVTVALLLALVARLGVGMLPDAAKGATDFRLKAQRGTADDQRLLESLRGQDGLLLWAPQVASYWPQLYTRRGPPLDPDIADLMTYVPVAAPATERALVEIFGTSVRRREGWSSYRGVRAVWEGNSRTRWRTLARQFRATDVLVPHSWDLDLPLIKASPGLAAYRLPRISPHVE